MPKFCAQLQPENSIVLDQERNDTRRNAEGFTDRAIDRAEMDDLDFAMKLLNHAIDIDPRYALAYYNRGVVKARQKDCSGARADFIRASTLDPSLETQRVLPSLDRKSSRFRRAPRSNQRDQSYREELVRMLHKQNFLCQICNSDMSSFNTSDVHIDHIIPLSRGGSNDTSNLQATCRTCNLRKADTALSNCIPPLI